MDGFLEMVETVLDVCPGAETAFWSVLAEFFFERAFGEDGFQKSVGFIRVREGLGDDVRDALAEKGYVFVGGRSRPLGGGHGVEDLRDAEGLVAVIDGVDAPAVALHSLAGSLGVVGRNGLTDGVLSDLPAAEDGVGEHRQSLRPDPYTGEVPAGGVGGDVMEFGEGLVQVAHDGDGLLVGPDAFRHPGGGVPLGEDLLVELRELGKAVAASLVVLVDEFIDALDLGSVLFGESSNEGVIGVDCALRSEEGVHGDAEHLADVVGLQGVDEGLEVGVGVHRVEDILRQPLRQADVAQVQRQVVHDDAVGDGVALLLCGVHGVAALEVRARVGRVSRQGGDGLALCVGEIRGGKQFLQEGGAGHLFEYGAALAAGNGRESLGDALLQGVLDGSEERSLLPGGDGTVEEDVGVLLQGVFRPLGEVLQAEAGEGPFDEGLVQAVGRGFERLVVLRQIHGVVEDAGFLHVLQRPADGDEIEGECLGDGKESRHGAECHGGVSGFVFHGGLMLIFVPLCSGEITKDSVEDR